MQLGWHRLVPLPGTNRPRFPKGKRNPFDCPTCLFPCRKPPWKHNWQLIWLNLTNMVLCGKNVLEEKYRKFNQCLSCLLIMLHMTWQCPHLAESVFVLTLRRNWSLWCIVMSAWGQYDNIWIHMATGYDNTMIFKTTLCEWTKWVTWSNTDSGKDEVATHLTYGSSSPDRKCVENPKISHHIRMFSRENPHI